MKRIFLLLAASLIVSVCTCQQKGKDRLSVDFERYLLSNGLNVILHEDHSDPIVAVAIQYHVGSSREVPGKTGFAHLFEHMMFQRSENVGQDQFQRKIQEAGGTVNGGTNKDGTIYYEVVPKNFLETVLWMESDRMGYLLNTVTQSAFTNQQNVVQNEKRQNYDNRPYGYNGYIVARNLYPEEHPYNWLTIGEMEDLLNASVDDVKAFHRKYYVPNNATLVVAGDIEAGEVKAIIEKYFGEIPQGEKVIDMAPKPVSLGKTKKLYHEDNLAKAPMLSMVWPTVEQYNKDAYALNLLAELLGGNRTSPMYRILVEDKRLTPRVSVYNSSLELAGEFTISITANAGTSLADAEREIHNALKKFEQTEFTESDLDRIKANLETQFYNSIGSVLIKSFQLAKYNEYAGTPAFISRDVSNIRDVTIRDIKRVYQKYIKDKPYVGSSIVPKGELNLVAENSIDAGIIEEDITNASEVKTVYSGEEVILKTPSKIDRSVEPVPGPDPVISVPVNWTGKLKNGIKVSGIEFNEVPLVQFSISIEGGQMLEKPEKAGIANLVARLLMEGTSKRTPEELEEAIDHLGAYINVYAGREDVTITANCLARNYKETLSLVREILLEPRWDTDAFELTKANVLNDIKRNMASPNYLTSRTMGKLMYGEDNIFSFEPSGTLETVGNIGIEDVKEWYMTVFSPSLASMQIVGDLSQEEVMRSLAILETQWTSKKVAIPSFDFPSPPLKPSIYFIDVPGAKQSVILIGKLSIPRTDKDFYPLTVVNYRLGGSFNGFLNMILREEKGFTYGARSSVTGGRYSGVFVASASVRSNATLESVEIFKSEMDKYRQGISDEDLTFTKEAILKGNALRFETIPSLVGMLTAMNKYDLPTDYVRQEEQFVRNLTSEKHLELVGKYIDPDRMYYVIAGDAATQVPELVKAGFGEPVLVKY
ncbi:MAG: insulinase family protein [Bacteroidales bacterium]|nr:insulinase family protein [Bacteroidales bacterium]